MAQKETFSEKLTRLEKIATELEQGSDVTKAVGLFEEGGKLVKELQGELSKLENKVEVIKKSFEQQPAVEDSPPAPGPDSEEDGEEPSLF